MPQVSILTFFHFGKMSFLKIVAILILNTMNNSPNICTKMFPIELEDVLIISPVSNEKIPLVGNIKCSNK